MAKHRFDRIRIQATRYLVLAALVLGWGVSMSRAGQQSASNPTQGAKSGSARTSSGRSAKTTAARKSTTDNSASASMVAGKRDPFKLPEFATGRGGGGSEGGAEVPLPGVLPPGKRGLVISQLRLEGVVRQQTANKLTAVVVDQRKLAYFLHENDSVYNGVVSKITPDSVYFKENVLDPQGHVTTREVVKRLGAALGEGR
jgi:hypothetical protein